MTEGLRRHGIVIKSGSSLRGGQLRWWIIAVVGAKSFLTSVSFGQEYPSLQKVQIEVNVTRDSSTSMFYYDYSLANDAHNIGSVYEFGVDISRDPNAVAYDTIGLRFAGIGFMESDYRKDYPVLGARVLPVGFLSLPPGWISFWGNMPEASVLKDRAFIAPGQSVHTIVLMSKGLPGIRGCVARPDFEVDRYFPDMDSPASDSLDPDKMDSIMDACNFYGLTVGPWAPPAMFDPVVFLDTLTSFVGQSRSEGWITSDAGADQFLHLLSDAKHEIQRDHMKAAFKCFDTVLRRVAADSPAVLRPEARALIRFNTEYVIMRLRQGHSGG